MTYGEIFLLVLIIMLVISYLYIFGVNKEK